MMKRGSKTESSGMWGGLLVGITALIFALVPISAQAASITFDDDAGTQTGTLSYDGLGGALVGTDIDFFSIRGDGTDLNAGPLGTLDCVGCVLNFTTGANITDPGGTGVYTWDTGGAFTLTGTANDGGGAFVAGGVLLSGTFAGSIEPSLLNAGGFSVFAGFGIDEKNLDLLAYFGEDDELNEWTFANTEISAAGTVDPIDGSFLFDVANADIENTQVPEPGSLLLLGSGLAGLGLWGWRRKKLQETA